MKNLKILTLALLIISNCAFYGTCQKTETEDFNALLAKCENLFQKDDKQGAVKCYEKAVIINSESYSAHVALANKYEAVDKLDNAESEIKKALELRPKEGGGHWIYGGILQKQGKFREALMEYQTTVLFEPNNHLYWLDLGLLQDKLNETDGAIISFEKVLELKPNYDLALYYLGNLYYQKGEIDESIEIFDKLFEISPEFEKEGKEQLERIKRERDAKKKAKAKSIGSN